MTRAQRIALAMRGYGRDQRYPTSYAIVSPTCYLARESQWVLPARGSDGAMGLVRVPLYNGEILRAPQATTVKPHTFVLLAREKGLPCS